MEVCHLKLVGQFPFASIFTPVKSPLLEVVFIIVLKHRSSEYECANRLK
jgi:hypothetical protein